MNSTFHIIDFYFKQFIIKAEGGKPLYRYLID